jgi:hypothetical protein
VTDEPIRELLLDALDRPFTFRQTTPAVPPEMRPQWRVAILALVLSRCRQHRASWKQLHLLNWAIRNSRARNALLEVAAGKRNPERVVVRFDPALAPAVDLARGAGFVQWQDGRLLVLAQRGAEMASVVETADVFSEELAFLDAMRGHMTQAFADRILGGPA